MELYLLDSNFQTLGIIDDYMSLIWRRKYKTVGDFELHCNPLATALLVSSKYVYRADCLETGMIEQLNAVDDRVTVKGRFLEAILEDKVIWPAKSYTSKTQEYIARDLVSSLTGIPLGATAGLGMATNAQITGNKLMEYVYELLATQELSPRIVYNYERDALEFTVWKGKDRRQSQSVNSWAIFSRNWDNLKESSYSYSCKDYRNYAYVAGAGESNDRTVVAVDMRAAPESRKRELWVDARDLQQGELSNDQYAALLRQRGVEKLAEYPVVEKFDATISTDSALEYMTDYDLGDLCTTNNTDYGISLDARIIEIEEAYENGHLTIKAQFGEGYLSVTDYIRRRFK